MSKSGSSGFFGFVLLILGLAFGLYQSMQLEMRGDRTQASLIQTISERYCEASHPFETWREVRQQKAFQAGTLYGPLQPPGCERQHLIQQQTEICQDNIADCHDRTVWWPKGLHTYTDRSSYKPFARDNPWFLSFTTRNQLNLGAAYKMGTYGLDWHIVWIDYKKRYRTKIVSLQMDGVSNLLYFWSWLVNTPQKFFAVAWWGVEQGRWDLIGDLAFSVLKFACIDLPVAILCTAVGVVVGTVMHLPSTIFALPGGVILAFRAAYSAVANFF